MIRRTINKFWNWSTITPARAVVVALLILAVLAAGSLSIYKLAQPNLSCAAGVQKIGTECISVTDGNFIFTSDIAGVEAAILRENQFVDSERSRMSPSRF